MTGRACTIYPFVSVKVIELLGPIRRLVAANGLSFVAIQFEELAPLCMGNVRVYIRFTNKKKKKIQWIKKREKRENVRNLNFDKFRKFDGILKKSRILEINLRYFGIFSSCKTRRYICDSPYVERICFFTKIIDNFIVWKENFLDRFIVLPHGSILRAILPSWEDDRTIFKKKEEDDDWVTRVQISIFMRGIASFVS